MKGLFIPEITTEMFRNGCLESIEALMAEGKIYDIDYQQPCEDAISRKAVLDKLNKLIEVERLQGTDEMGYGRERVSAYESMIFEIESKYLYPSVNPQQPCEDCISRQATVERLCKVADFTNEKREGLGSPYIMAALFIQDNKDEFPSVTPKEKTRKGEWLRMSNLSEQEDDRYKCSHCGNVVHHRDKINLYTFNSWCGRCGSDNGRKMITEEK